MSRWALVAALLLLVLAGCTRQVDEQEAVLHDDEGPFSLPLPLHFFLEDDHDVILAIEVLGPGDVPIEVTFSNSTPDPEAKAFARSFFALPDGHAEWRGHTYYWGDWEALSVTARGEYVGAGPAIDPILGEVLWGEDWSTIQWNESLSPGRYYGLLAVERASADVRVSVSDEDRGRVELGMVASGVDATDKRITFNPDDFDEMTQVYSYRTFVVDLHHTINIREPLNWLAFLAPGPFQWTLSGEDVHCGSEPGLKLPVEGGHLINVPPGEYTFDATGAADIPFLWLSTYQVPTHESIELVFDSSIPQCR